MVPFSRHWKVLSHGHLVFNIRIFPNVAMANQSEKVGMSQIQQAPYGVWYFRELLTKVKIVVKGFVKSFPEDKLELHNILWWYQNHK